MRDNADHAALSLACSEHLGLSGAASSVAADRLLRAARAAAALRGSSPGDLARIATAADAHAKKLRSLLGRLKALDPVGTAAADPLARMAYRRAQMEATSDADAAARQVLECAVARGIFQVVCEDLDHISASLGYYLAAAEDGQLDRPKAADAVAEMAAKIYAEATGNVPSFNNERETPFARFLGAAFQALGIRQAPRHPARRAVAAFKAGPVVEQKN
jgi:hypothetical protein